MTDTARLDRSVLPIHYDLLIETDADATRSRARSRSPWRSRRRPRRSCSTPRTSTSSWSGSPSATRPLEAAPLGRPRVGADHRPDAASARRAGPPELTLRFAAPVSPGLLGYYRSTYVDETGAERVLAATQFEAPHARRAFPCFDEPEFKAIFGVTLVVADGLLAISNGPEIEREPLGDGRVRVRFANTIPMSTYLVAWVVGPARCSPIRSTRAAWRCGSRTCPGKEHLTQFALDVGSFAIRFFADYYGIPYPGEKCDLVALPDFSFGAMENLGCVTFREARLLLDPDQVDARRDVRRRAHDRARGRAHVVRRPRDHEVVERHLAQRGVRHVHGAPRRRRVPRGVEDVGRLRARPRRRARRRRALQHAHRRVRGHHARRRRRHVRPPHLPKGRLGPAHARALARRRRVPRRRAPLPRPLPAREHRDDRPVGLARVGDRASRCAASWTRGSSSRVSRSCRRRRSPARSRSPRTGSGTKARRRAQQRWAIPVRARVHDGGSADRHDLAARRRQRRRSTSRPTRWWCSTRAARASTACPTRREWRDRLLDAGVLEPLERFSLVDDLWAAVLAGEAPRRGVPHARPAGYASETTSSCGARSWACCAAPPGSSKATRSRGSAPRSPTCWRRHRPDWEVSPRPARTRGPASSAASCSTRSERWWRTRPRSRGRASSTRPEPAIPT